MIVGLGGGLMRDILLNQLPAAISDNWYIPIATAAALLGMLLQRVFSRLNGLIIALDAVTIGLFGAIGTSKALAYGVPVVPAIFVGVLSAVGGSILRDVALNLPIALMHVGSLYAVAATAGTTLLVVLVAFDVNIVIAGTACVIVTTLIRLGLGALRLEPARAAGARQLAGVAARLTRRRPSERMPRRRVRRRATDAARRRAAAASGDSVRPRRPRAPSRPRRCPGAPG